MQRLGDRLLSWASILDDATRAQAELAASLPFVRPHPALMPDAHLGRGATVGSVLPTAGAVIPAAVGVDIGCGMIAVRTQHLGAELAGRGLPALRRAIERAVPLSAGRYHRTVPPGSTAQRRVGELRELAASASFDPGGYAPNWPLQLGTLGGGNHFIEVCVDEQDRVWLFLHSGSRGIGNKIATRHIAVAKRRCAARRADLPDPDLAYLTEDEPEFGAYLSELRWAQHFALLNREEMMDRVIRVLRRLARPRRRAGADQLSSQLHRARAPRRRRGLAHPQGRDQRRARPARPHPRLHGHRELRRDRQRQPAGPELRAARRRQARAPRVRAGPGREAAA